MAPVHGSKASLKIGTFALPATLTDVSQYTNTAAVALTRDNAETTTLQKNSKTYIPGLKDGTFPLDGPFDPVIDQILWDIFNNGTIVNFEYDPAGAGVTGTPKFTGQGFVTAYNVNSAVSGAAGESASFQITGDVTRVVQ